MEYKPAIVTVGYDRVDSIKCLWESIENATYDGIENIVLIASIDQSDKSDKIAEEFEMFKWTHGSKRLIRYSEKQGLKKHIISCGDLSEEYGSVIILEDDLIVSPEFYNYTINALGYYGKCEKICGISLYSHRWNGYVDCEFTPESNGFDVYWGQFSITWGQCWTKENWKSFKDWYIANQTFSKTSRLPDQVFGWGEKSWGKFFFKYIVENNLFYVIPYVSMSTNCSGVGEHCNRLNSTHQVPLARGKQTEYSFPDEKEVIKYDAFFERFFDDSVFIEGIAGKDICVDLNASKQNSEGKPFILTTRKLKYPIIKTYGFNLRPIEENVLLNIPGNDIYLYDIKGECVQLKKKSMSMRRFAYEAYGLRWNKMIQYGVYLFAEKAKARIEKVARNVGNKK